MPGDRWWASDQRYFSLLAEPEPVPGGFRFASDRYADLPPGFVASVPDAGGVDDPAGWVADLTAAAATAGARLLRAYLPDGPTPLACFLERLGFSPRAEVGVLLPPGATVAPGSGAEVHPIESESDWAEELVLQRTIERAWLDGDVDPERWVALERAQCDAGATRYLVRDGGVTVASFGHVPDDPLQRPKSVVVHPCHRGRGHVATVFAFILRGVAGHECAVGGVAVEGGAGHRSYVRLGLETRFRFVEWSRPT